MNSFIFDNHILSSSTFDGIFSQFVIFVAIFLIPFSDDYSYNLKRRTSKRPSHVERDAEASSIFQFDLCSDLEDSEESIPLSTVQVKKENISTAINQSMNSYDQCEIPCEKSYNKQFCDNGNLKFSKTIKSSVQKSITSYGRIKKDNAVELVKIGAFSKSKTTKSKISPKDRVISPTLYFKVRQSIPWYISDETVYLSLCPRKKLC